MTIKHLIPTLRYKDAKQMVEWLCNTWNFEKHVVIEGEDQSISHAQLLAGELMIMIGSVQNQGEYGNSYSGISHQIRKMDGCAGISKVSARSR